MAKLIFVPIADQIQSGTYLLYDGACGTSCQGSVHLPNCDNSCCTAITGYSGSGGTLLGQGTSSGGVACGGTCGTIGTSYSAGCG